MQMQCKYIVSILFLIFGLNAHAQDFEILKIGTTYYPKQSIKESTQDGQTGFWEWSGQLAIPQPLKNKKTIFIHTLRYSNLRVDLEASTGILDTELTKYFHTIFYSLGYVQILNPKWRVVLSLNPMLASDFEESLSDEDFLFQGSAIAMNTKSKKLNYGFGLAYTTRFGREIVLPLMVLKYKTPKMTIDISLPSKLSAMFNTHKKFQYGLKAVLNGGLFNINGQISGIDAMMDATGYSRLIIGPAITLRLKDAINLNLNGGMAVAGTLEFIDINEDTYNRTPENGPFFRIGLAFSPKKKNNQILSEN